MTHPGEGGGHPDGDADARGRILGRIRSALEKRGALSHPGAAPVVEPGAPADADSLVQRFARALGQSGGEVVVVEEVKDAARWLADFTKPFGSAAVSGRVPGALRPALPAERPRDAALGVSVALAGAAATGSLLLSSEEGRALQLLPPVHLIWIERSRVFAELADALRHVRAAGRLPAALGVHSGPSKSADIGRIVVTGVHGPGRLVAVVTGFALGGT